MFDTLLFSLGENNCSIRQDDMSRISDWVGPDADVAEKTRVLENMLKSHAGTLRLKATFSARDAMNYQNATSQLYSFPGNCGWVVLANIPAPHNSRIEQWKAGTEALANELKFTTMFMSLASYEKADYWESQGWTRSELPRNRRTSNPLFLLYKHVNKELPALVFQTEPTK